jgi:hypothetical protein
MPRKIRGMTIALVPKQNAQEWRVGDVYDNSNRSFHAFRVPLEPEAGK